MVGYAYEMRSKLLFYFYILFEIIIKKKIEKYNDWFSYYLSEKNIEELSKFFI